MKKLLTIFAAFIMASLLLSCSEPSTSDLYKLYLDAIDGDTSAQRELYNCSGKDAGRYQEQMGDYLAYKDPSEAEKWWKRARANGVTNGGPNFYLLFILRKYWYLVFIPLIIYIIYKVSSDNESDYPFNDKPESNIPLNSILLIDTNVWMAENLDSWFDELEQNAKENGWCVQLESIVLGELKGLSKNEVKRNLAQLGMVRIERIQASLGNNFQLVNNATSKDTIADTVLIKTAKRQKDSILITNDRELRILAKDKGVNARRSAECQF